MNNQSEKPIEELLRGIPQDHRICIPFQWAEDGRETGHHYIPVGRHVHQAADKITSLREQLAEAIVVRDRSITRMVEMAEPGFIGAFAAKDRAVERAKKADAENAALRKDAERLNWLERQDYDDLSFELITDRPNDGYHAVSFGGLGWYVGKTLREAIDAAMKEVVK